MRKIILDTNVLVSSLIQRGYPYLIVSEIFDNRNIELCISEELLEEYRNVLNRKKFSKFSDFEINAQALLLDIETHARKYSPTVKIDIITDKDDNKLLELAEESDAGYLITGNHNDFTMSEHKNTKIITPKRYWEEVVMKNN